MATRVQRRNWVCANVLCLALAVTRFASAAQPNSGLPQPTLPSPPLPRLVLTQPGPLPPSRSFRHEIVWLGMRIPTLIAFGLSSVSAGGAVVSGFAATRGNDPGTCDTRCAERDVRRRGLMITTGVLTGMAVAGLGIGVTFMLNEPRDPKANAIRPRLDLGVSGRDAVAKIGWVFTSF